MSTRFAKVPVSTFEQVALYLALFIYMVYLLLGSRTPTGAPVWTIFDPSYLGVYFVMSLLLLALIAKKGNSTLKLTLIILHSITAHIFWVALYETRMGFDQWIGIWVARGAYTGEVPQWNLFTPMSLAGLVALTIKVFHFSQMVLSPYLSALLSRMFYVDVYWIHPLLVPVLWGTLVPIIAYGISKMLCNGERTHLLVALLTVAIPSLISWGAGTVSNSFAFLLFFFTVYLSLRYVSGKGNIILLGFLVVLSLLEHALVGIVSLSMVIIAFFYRKYQTGEITRFKERAFWLAFLASILLLPLSLYARRWTTTPFVGGTPSLQPLLQLSGYDAILQLIFGGYAKMTFNDALLTGIVPFIGFIGLVYIVFSKNELNYSRKLSRFILLIFLLIIIEYTITKNFMVGMPFSPERIPTFRDFLAILFFPVALESVAGFFLIGKAASHKVGTKMNPSVIRHLFVKAVPILSVAAFITAVLFASYPKSGVVFVTGYELEAVRYIEATTHERYVVISDESVTWAGSSTVGLANPRAFYSPAYGPPPGYAPYVPTSGVGSLLWLYEKMLEDPSLAYIFQAKQINNASVVYVILTKSKLDARLLDADEIFSEVEGLPYTQLEKVIGNDTYVFASRPPLAPIESGEGPSVYVYNLDKHVNTTRLYDIINSKSNYTLVLSGSTNYKLTWWPIYWSFEVIKPTPLELEIDANSWVNFTAVPERSYQVVWSSNEVYRSVGWRDDSFKTAWVDWIKSGWSDPPIMSTDGDILTLTGVFQEKVNSYWYFTAEVGNVSTIQYPYLIMKWKSTDSVTYAWVGYADGTSDNVLYWGSYSPNWDLKVLKLRPGTAVNKLLIGFNNLGKDTVSGTQSAYFDFIFLASKS